MAIQNPSPAPKNSQFSPEIMEQLKKEKAPSERMTPLEIIRKSSASEDMGDMSPEQAYAGLLEACKSDKFRIFRANNSMLAYSILGGGVVEAHLITADEPITLMKSIKSFAVAMKKSNFNQIKTTTPNPQIVRLLKSAGLDVQSTMSHETQGDQASPAFEVTINLR